MGSYEREVFDEARANMKKRAKEATTGILRQFTMQSPNITGTWYEESAKVTEEAFENIRDDINKRILKSILEEGSQKMKIEDYEVVDAFNIIDIYKQDPCKDQFLRLLMEENRVDALGTYWDQMDEIEESKTLMDNLDWLLNKGFIRKKVKDIYLKGGMRLVSVCGDSLVTSEGSIIDIKDGVLLFNGQIFSTLRDLNDVTPFNFKVKE